MSITKQTLRTVKKIATQVRKNKAWKQISTKEEIAETGKCRFAIDMLDNQYEVCAVASNLQAYLVIECAKIKNGMVSGSFLDTSITGDFGKHVEEAVRVLDIKRDAKEANKAMSKNFAWI